MSKGKGAAAYVVAAAAMMMFFTGCETTKHAEVMSAEELARQQAAQAAVKGAGAEEGGLPLSGQGLSEGSIAMGKGAGDGSSAASMLSDGMTPQAPPLPTLRDVGEGMGADTGVGTIADTRGTESGMANGGVSPTPSSSGETLVESSTGGPSGYEGQQFVQGLTPSDFVPEGPPQPNLGHSPFSQDLSMVAKAPEDKRPEVARTPDSGDEVVKLPDHGGNGTSMEPLGHDDMGGGFQPEETATSGAVLDHVYFDFDKYVIRVDAVSTLRQNADLLNGKYKFSTVLIEGHCDERGTTEYNLVLGERRAQAVKNYLADLGVASSRIQIVSYGKERPSCSVSEEWCWQKNRRGHFRLH